MFRKKSLRFKISFVILAFIILMTLAGIILGNLFLDRYYLHNKQNALVSVFGEVDQSYLDGLDLPDDDEDDTEDEEEDDDNNNILFNGDETIKLAYASGTISDDLALKLDKLSLSNNMSIIVYREIQEHLYDYMMNTHTNLLLYTSLGETQDSVAESNNIFRDYYNGQNPAADADAFISSEENYSIKKVNVQRLGASYIYLQGKLKNQDTILIRVSVEGIQESVRFANRFYIYLMVLTAIIIFIALFISTSHFLKPVDELTKMAKRMAQLDFTAKYEVTTEDEIGDLGRSINMMSESLEHALSELKGANAQLSRDLEKRVQIDDMRKEFLSNISHELKTPIALIQGYAEGLQDNINEDEESRQFYCDVIIDESKKMNNMVKQIMALNQLEFGYSNVNMEYFDIVELVRTILEKSGILISQAQANLIIDESEQLFVWSDPFLAEEVFTNYLTNALHHLEGERLLKISFEKCGDHVKVGVFNSGKPIPEADLPRVWEKFYKVDKPRTREYGGSGVGLSIVKAIMELLGQRYGAENLDDGVLFWFTLDNNHTSGSSIVSAQGNE